MEFRAGAKKRIIIEDNSFLEEFEKEFKDDVFGTQLILLAKKAYQKGRTFTEATQILVQEIFAEFGLLMIDGDDVLLKNQMQNIFKEAFSRYTIHESRMLRYADRRGKKECFDNYLNKVSKFRQNKK